MPPETLTYESVARDIISKSISTAVFIDDKALETFKTKNYSPRFIGDHNRSISLYRDFKSKNCLLHSFKFTKSGWSNNKDFCIKNKDLLILDWQLVGQDHLEALKILDYSVKEKSLHFACIYTQASQDSVKNELNKFYWGKVSLETKIAVRESLDETDLNDIWLLDINHDDWIRLDELLNNIINADDDQLDNEVENLRVEYNLDHNNIQTFKGIHSSGRIAFSKLKTILTNDDVDLSFTTLDSSNRYSISQQDQYTFYINHTIVKIFPKNDLSGDELYDAFFNSFLSSEQNIFFTLMGLEMRNRFKENSAFIGKDFDSISEDAFFFHKIKNDAHPFIFIDFLREILKDQVASFLYEKKLNLFEVLDDYYVNNDGANRQSYFNLNANIERFHREVYKLNNFYNKLNIQERSKNDFLRFGDIFESSFTETNADGDEVNLLRYFICLTPHCDCLNPRKVDNQFWFIEGKVAPNSSTSKKKILKGTDGKYISFIKINKTIEAIYWENSSFEMKPKAFYVENNRFTDNLLQVMYNNQRMEFKLISSLKENYAQRIANKAFGYPLRVGIDFVKKS